MGSLLVCVLLLLGAALPWLAHGCALHIGVCGCGLDGDTNRETIDVGAFKVGISLGTYYHLESHFGISPVPHLTLVLVTTNELSMDRSQSWHMTWRPAATWGHTFFMMVYTRHWCLQSQSRMEMRTKKWGHCLEIFLWLELHFSFLMFAQLILAIDT